MVQAMGLCWLLAARVLEIVFGFFCFCLFALVLHWLVAPLVHRVELSLPEEIGPILSVYPRRLFPIQATL